MATMFQLGLRRLFVLPTLKAINLQNIGNIFAQPFLGLCFRLSARHGADDVAVAGVSD